MKRKTVWFKVRSFFAAQYDKGPLWQTVWRGRMLREKMGSPSQVETYRLYLTRAGYIQRVARGMYRVVKPIPTTLTSSQVYKEAYGLRR